MDMTANNTASGATAEPSERGACRPPPREAHQKAAPQSNSDPVFGDVIYSYTRAAAFSDGYLVDVSETAREAGFRVPVALTRAAWDDCVEWDDTDTTRKHWPQDQSGRLWDVLWMAHLACRRAGGERVMFEVYRVPREGRGVKARRVVLVATIGPGDTPEPVITIGQPDDF